MYLGLHNTYSTILVILVNLQSNIISWISWNVGLS